MKSVSKHTISTCAVFVGLLLVAAGLLWPVTAGSKWPQEKAEEFAKSSAALHAAAHDRQERISEAEFSAIRHRFEKIKAELQSARQRPEIVAFWLKTVGAGLATIGLVSLFTGQHSN